jgi:hypothetical protein
MTGKTNAWKVFVAASRSLSRLNDDVRLRIDNVADEGLKVILGDAKGVDWAVQRHLCSRNCGPASALNPQIRQKTVGKFE